MVVCKVVLATSGAPGVKTKNSTHGNNERCVAAPSAPEVKVAAEMAVRTCQIWTDHEK